MDLFATKDQMANMSQGLIPATTLFLEDEIKAASRRIRDYCRWHIAKQQTGLIFRRRSRFVDEVWLPALRITAIESVVVNGKPVEDLTRIDFDPDTGWTSIRGAAVEVTYTAGFTEIPETLTPLTLHMAARALGNPMGIVRQQTGSASVTYAQAASGAAAGGNLLPGEEQLLDAYRIARVS
ncbi:hypothetical protein [Microbacterium oleivorans]|uniref:Uncharacterized protein n=1 Tax=Microbacterium oleivorans TaxID=273677 RepID=A0A7D5IW78_9MICO|nr:hypothetical protein [Microbacterium oleivorans]QLD10896.1 hypothetical protein HW566_03310 [Microbacterium oleivorans]